ncbi:transport permease protein [Longispora fulva]|uniref:Transport permease protein n=1 Tax=Longispora fulva TaxID=619741 RepID=A0A8J7GHY6_9ACTN|nr:ABC transporter permease [Longispora fulva]MBG6136688.1 ABC-2 type transport system permease protein/oleandomycin transport system permease protein [Longispora fulva]GIG59857.1 transport permease protein [Longispora fulva]
MNARRPHGGIVLGAVRDTLAITGRNLIAFRRVPQLMVFTFIQPVIFVLLFRYVFGGAIRGAGTSYVNYLMPGIFVQVVVFGSMATAVGLASDMRSGLLERFRALPMARSAVLAGRTLADLTRNMFVVVLIAVVGFLVGFRVHGTVGRFLAGMGLVLLFAYTLSWVLATLGMAVGDPESAQAAAFPIIAPLVFASSIFIPVHTMPGWLQPFAEHQPVSVTASAVRALMEGGAATSYVVQSVAWCLGILAICAPLAVWRYRRTV